jgi:TPR repeat protein
MRPVFLSDASSTGLRMGFFRKLFSGRTKPEPAPTAMTHEGIEQLLNSGNYPAAARQLFVLMQQHDPWAHFWLSRLCASGLGMPKDDVMAVKFARIAAEAGYAPAQSGLGFFYSVGRGVEQDHQEALKWLTLAAENGDAGAQFNLSRAYSNGLGAKADDRMAAIWMMKAAENGMPAAKLGVAIWTLLGKGLPRDPQRATELLEPLAAQGDAEAKVWLERARAQDATVAYSWETPTGPKATLH